MKVFMFAPYCYPVPGGQETHLHNLMCGLRKSGVDVALLARPQFSKSKISTGVFYARSLFRLPREGVDLIHGHDIHVGAVLRLYHHLSKVPSVLTVHSSIFLETYKKYPGFYRGMFNNQKAIITTSSELRDACSAVTDTPVHYIPNGVDTEQFRPGRSDFARRAFGIPEDSRIILTTRRLDRKNNVIALAEAFDALKTENTHLVIVGDGEQRSAIESLKNPRIHIAGFVRNDSIPDYLNSADVFAIPSLYEATSISCLEAMACGLPVIVTNVGGLPDLIDGNGIICEPNKESLRGALETMLEKDRTHMGEKSRTIAEGKFSWERITKHYLKLYASVLG